jgi:hypothetical protein
MKNVSVTMRLLESSDNVLVTRRSRNKVGKNKVSATPCSGNKVMEDFPLFLLSLLFFPKWTDHGIPLFHVLFLLI